MEAQCDFRWRGGRLTIEPRNLATAHLIELRRQHLEMPVVGKLGARIELLKTARQEQMKTVAQQQTIIRREDRRRWIIRAGRFQPWEFLWWSCGTPAGSNRDRTWDAAKRIFTQSRGATEKKEKIYHEGHKGHEELHEEKSCCAPSRAKNLFVIFVSFVVKIFSVAPRLCEKLF